jgi:hypothetical protein
MASVFNAYLAYQFIKILTTPWNETEAFKNGIVDDEGNILKNSNQLKTDAEKKSFTVFHKIIFNLKRILEKFPGGKSRIATYAAAMALLKENKENLKQEDSQLLEVALLDYINILEEEYHSKEVEPLNEMWYNDVINAVKSKTGKKKVYDHALDTLLKVLQRKKKESGRSGLKHSINYYSAQIAKTYSGVDGKTLATLMKQTYPEIAEEFVVEDIANVVGDSSNVGGFIQDPHQFAGMKIFKVKPDSFNKFMWGKKKYGRWENFIEKDAAADIRRYIKSNPHKKIVLQDQNHGTMIILHRDL